MMLKQNLFLFLFFAVYATVSKENCGGKNTTTYTIVLQRWTLCFQIFIEELLKIVFFFKSLALRCISNRYSKTGKKLMPVAPWLKLQNDQSGIYASIVFRWMTTESVFNWKLQNGWAATWKFNFVLKYALRVHFCVIKFWIGENLFYRIGGVLVNVRIDWF